MGLEITCADVLLLSELVRKLADILQIFQSFLIVFGPLLHIVHRFPRL